MATKRDELFSEVLSTLKKTLEGTNRLDQLLSLEVSFASVLSVDMYIVVPNIIVKFKEN